MTSPPRSDSYRPKYGLLATYRISAPGNFCSSVFLRAALSPERGGVGACANATGIATASPAMTPNRPRRKEIKVKTIKFSGYGGGRYRLRHSSEAQVAPTHV